jgi:hypothetical protein
MLSRRFPPGAPLSCAQLKGAAVDQTKSTINAPAELVELVYELLDAHDDTARLARAGTDDHSWAAHLEYLVGLQRVGRETLARIAN